MKTFGISAEDGKRITYCLGSSLLSEHEKLFGCTCWGTVSLFVRSSNSLLRGDRMDGSKEGDETIVNHFHGVSSSSEARRDVCGQTDPGSCILLDRAYVK
jgi:hypothetical protein